MSFHKIIIKIEMLCPDDDAAEAIDRMSLEQIGHCIMDGDCSGVTEVLSDEKLTGKEAADALIEQGSDPEFFMIDEDGKEI